MQKLRNLALGASAIALALSSFMVCAMSGSRAFAATAEWSEEMNALPGAQWGLHDDFQSLSFKNAITLIDPSGGAGTGAWKHPSVTHPGGGTHGVALVSGNDNPINAIPGMISPTAQFTAEIRYKIVSPFSLLADGDDAFWFNVGSGHMVDDSGADTRNFEGRYGSNGFTSISGEGFLGSDPGFLQTPFAGTSRGEWHTMRVIQDEEADTQDIYIDNTLMATHNTAGYNRATGFTRGIAFGFYNHPAAGNAFSEVHYDYIRIANGVVPIGTPIDAPGGATFDAADFDENGSVGTADYNAWATNFGLASGANKGQGNSDADGDVDGGDFLKWQEQYGRGGGSFVAVPEPATALSVALMVGALVARRRRA